MDNGATQNGSTQDSREVSTGKDLLGIRQLYLRFRDKVSGHESPDPTVLVVPGQQAPPSLHEEIRRFMMTEFDAMAHDRDVETFEEADDFDIDDEEDLTTGYTVKDFMPEEGYPVESLDGELPPNSQENDQKVQDTISEDQENAVPQAEQ